MHFVSFNVVGEHFRGGWGEQRDALWAGTLPRGEVYRINAPWNTWLSLVCSLVTQSDGLMCKQFDLSTF